MITPEIPEELIEKMTRAYWNIAPAADYDVRASKPVEEVKAAVRDNLTVALSAVYSDIRQKAFEEAVQKLSDLGLQPSAYIVRSLAGKETP